MGRTLVFAGRNTKEILRDIFTLIFGILFPLVLLVLLTVINKSIPAEAGMSLFDIRNLLPGVAVFGLSFISLFTATIVSKDRCTSFILRLFTSPLKPSQYILGYTLPLIPVALVQIIVCYIAAFFMGLEYTPNIFPAILVNVPTAILYIATGLLCGTIFNDKMVGGVCGALLTNLSAWLSSTWFDIELIGGTFEKVANLLPFIHAVKAGRFALSGEFSEILSEVLWVSGYAVAIAVIAAVLFNYKMKQDK